MAALVAASIGGLGGVVYAGTASVIGAHALRVDMVQKADDRDDHRGCRDWDRDGRRCRDDDRRRCRDWDGDRHRCRDDDHDRWRDCRDWDHDGRRCRDTDWDDHRMRGYMGIRSCRVRGHDHYFDDGRWHECPHHDHY